MIKKIVIAVHGIGDQVRNDTVLSTTERFCDYHNYGALLPLGGFHDALQDGHPPFVVDGNCPTALHETGFGEVYWAHIPRRVVRLGYTLQETKAWARSVVDRVDRMSHERNRNAAGIDYRQVRQVLDELITTIGVLELLCLVVRKAGLAEINLQQLLDDYLGDVQVVTEFEDLRARIVGTFHQTLAAAHAQVPAAEIHVIAHSEGTVVAFLGLLEALSEPDKHPWIGRVRGFMTIGSPIDKHLLLWPSLFRHFNATGWPADFVHPVIHWRNYTDYGDPIGFELDTAREWLTSGGGRSFKDVFQFGRKDDYLFSRYFLPGKAHVDYWEDDTVFAHFIREVVEGGGRGVPPPDVRFASLAVYTAGYGLPLVLVFLSSYILHKGIINHLPPDLNAGGELVRSVAAFGGLVAGMTICARLSRLTRSWWWGFFGVLIYAVTAGAFVWFMKCTPVLKWMALADVFQPKAVTENAGFLLRHQLQLRVVGISALVLLVAITIERLRRLFASPTVIGIAPDGVGSDPTRLRPAAATRAALGGGSVNLLVFTGGAALALVALTNGLFTPGAMHRAWPMLLLGGAALGVWWLAMLVFDLVFVWHRYIRLGVALTFLRGAMVTREVEHQARTPMDWVLPVMSKLKGFFKRPAADAGSDNDISAMPTS